jgi:hypothetical protein
MSIPEKAPTGNNLYREERTFSVLRSIEYWRWTLAELATDLAAANDDEDQRVLAESVVFATYHLQEAVSELERRQRLRDHPAAPPWPHAWPSVLPDAQLVKDRLDISSYFARMGVELRRQGRGWVVRCDLPSHPGHDESPSLRISESGRGWHCFVCNCGGDLLTLHCARTGLSFVEALAELAADVGLMPREEVRRVG